MGGGDLNSKKSWHPNTMKNQERVWKAEQAAAEEKKRIMELQTERAAERDRAELNELAKRNAGADNEGRLHWMYDKPNKKAHQEDYLLGKAIEKNFDKPEKSDDSMPALSRRVVGSSMLTTGGDTQVDLARKMREDPLLLVKERERAARAALLNNPLHRKRLTELLRKEQEQKKEVKAEKKLKKQDKSLDNMLAAKLNSLGGEKSVDIVALLASDNSSSSSESSEEEPIKIKKKKKTKTKKSKKSKKKKKAKDSDIESSDNDDKLKKRKVKVKDKKQKEGKKDRKSLQSSDTEGEGNKKRNKKARVRDKRSESPLRQSHKDNEKKRRSSSSTDKEPKQKRGKRDVSEQRSRKKNHETKQDRELSKDQRDNSNTTKERKRRSVSKERKRKSPSNPDKEDRYKKVKENEDRGYKQYHESKHDAHTESDPREHPHKNKDRKRRSVSHSDNEFSHKRSRRDVSEDRNHKHRKQYRDDSARRSSDEKRRRSDVGQDKSTQGGLSEEEKAARLAAMMEAGAEREMQRSRRVAEQRAAEQRAAARPHAHLTPRAPAALPDSLEARIHSNRHYIQRDRRHMNEHFARR